MLSGWTEQQCSGSTRIWGRWRETVRVDDNAWRWCSAIGWLPSGWCVCEQEVLYKLRAAWTLASQEASIETTSFHTNRPLYKCVTLDLTQPHYPPMVALPACQACVEVDKPLVAANLIEGNFVFVSPSVKHPRREMLNVDNTVRRPREWAA